MTKLKLLLVSELNGQISHVTTVCERILCSNDSELDAVLVCGGIVQQNEEPGETTNELTSASEGDMMALISRLETIVCRVLYYPGQVKKRCSGIFCEYY